jgi:hypothetical protein
MKIRIDLYLDGEKTPEMATTRLSVVPAGTWLQSASEALICLCLSALAGEATCGKAMSRGRWGTAEGCYDNACSTSNGGHRIQSAMRNANA